MDLRTYLNNAPRGAGAAIAKALGVHPVMISQYAAGTKAVPEDRAPALEAATEFEVRCEESCSSTRWVRVAAEGWPHGKPLADKTPDLAVAGDVEPAHPLRRATDPEPAAAGQGG